MGQDEFQVISKYFQRSTEDSAVLLGIGDDAAVVEVAGPMVVTTDTSIAQQQRWVSLNQCVDQLLLRWAPQQLVGITYLSAAEPLLKTTAAHVTAHNGTLESILAL